MRLYPITVDSREKVPAPTETVRRLTELGVSAKVGTLEIGDFRWIVEFDDGEFIAFIVERKSLRDLTASVTDGRLNRFLDETQGVGGVYRVLLLEGDRSGDPDWPDDRIDNLLADAQTLGVVVIRSHSDKDTAARLASFWRHTGAKEHHTLAAVHRPLVTGYYFDPDVKDAVRGLMSLPGWGEVKCNAVLSVLHSVGAVLDAVRSRDYLAFRSVKGIGKGLIDNAADYLEKEVK